ncbi:MAG: hypothetical protein ACLQCB_18895 [Spirochaetia bacterium]
MGSEDLEKWLCESIRFTGFFASDVAVLQQKGWVEAATGKQPTARVEQSGTILEDLKIETGVRLSVQLQTFRIDIVLGVDAESPKRTGNINAIGDPITQHDHFLGYVKAIAAHPLFPVFNRLGLGLSCLRSFADIQTANRFAGHLLPTVQIDPEKAFDLMYRINRPKEIEIGTPKRKINRLATWSVFDLMAYVAVQPGPMVPLKTPVVRVDLDVNTFPDDSDWITHSLLAQVLESLSKNAFDILLEGDVR